MYVLARDRGGFADGVCGDVCGGGGGGGGGDDGGCGVESVGAVGGSRGW